MHAMDTIGAVSGDCKYLLFLAICVLTCQLFNLMTLEAYDNSLIPFYFAILESLFLLRRHKKIKYKCGTLE